MLKNFNLMICIYVCVFLYHIYFISCITNYISIQNTSNSNNKLCNISNNIWQTLFLTNHTKFLSKIWEKLLKLTIWWHKRLFTFTFFQNKYKQINSLFDDLKDYLSWWLLFITKSQYQLKDYLLWWLFFIIRPRYQLVVSSS